MTNIYRQKWEQLHRDSDVCNLCPCGVPVLIHNERDTGRDITLDAWPHAEGEWQIGAGAEFVYRPEFPVLAYREHRCEE